jgi:hypothetical protein
MGLVDNDETYPLRESRDELDVVNGTAISFRETCNDDPILTGGEVFFVLAPEAH